MPSSRPRSSFRPVLRLRAVRWWWDDRTTKRPDRQTRRRSGQRLVDGYLPNRRQFTTAILSSGTAGSLLVLELAPRLRRRASPLVLRLPAPLAAALEHDASLVRTGLSAARPYGWTELSSDGQAWRLDAYIPLEALSEL